MKLSADQMKEVQLPDLPPVPPSSKGNSILPSQFTRKNLQVLIHEITTQLKANGSKTPHIFLPFRSKVDDGNLNSFLSALFPNGELISNSPTVLTPIIKRTDEFTLICCLKYLWSRLPNNEVIGWDVYLEYKKREKEAGYPKDAFLTIMPKCLSSPAHASIFYDFLDLLISIASNSQHNYLSGRKIAKMSSIWVFNSNKLPTSAFYDATKENSFKDGLDFWKSSSDALFHLLLSFLRAMLPENDADALKLPKALQSLIITNSYPPELDDSMKTMITIPCVMVKSTKVSSNPYELLSKVRHTLTFEKRSQFGSMESYTILKNLFQKSSTAEIVETLTEESRRVLSRLTADPVESDYELYPGWSKDQPSTDADIPLFTQISILEVSLQDYYIWAWLSTLGSDQTSKTKKLFGRSIVVEAGLKGFQKWLVVTEQTMLSSEYLEVFKQPLSHTVSTSRTKSPNLAYDKFKEVPPQPSRDFSEPPSLPSKDIKQEQGLLPNINFEDNDDFSLSTQELDDDVISSEYNKYIKSLNEFDVDEMTQNFNTKLSQRRMEAPRPLQRRRPPQKMDDMPIVESKRDLSKSPGAMDQNNIYQPLTPEPEPQQVMPNTYEQQETMKIVPESQQVMPKVRETQQVKPHAEMQQEAVHVAPKPYKVKSMIPEPQQMRGSVDEQQRTTHIVPEPQQVVNNFQQIMPKVRESQQVRPHVQMQQEAVHVAPEPYKVKSMIPEPQQMRGSVDEQQRTTHIVPEPQQVVNNFQQIMPKVRESQQVRPHVQMQQEAVHVAPEPYKVNSMIPEPQPTRNYVDEQQATVHRAPEPQKVMPNVRESQQMRPNVHEQQEPVRLSPEPQQMRLNVHEQQEPVRLSPEPQQMRLNVHEQQEPVRLSPEPQHAGNGFQEPNKSPKPKHGIPKMLRPNLEALQKYDDIESKPLPKPNTKDQSPQNSNEADITNPTEYYLDQFSQNSLSPAIGTTTDQLSSRGTSPQRNSFERKSHLASPMPHVSPGRLQSPSKFSNIELPSKKSHIDSNLMTNKSQQQYRKPIEPDSIAQVDNREQVPQNYQQPQNVNTPPMLSPHLNSSEKLGHHDLENNRDRVSPVYHTEDSNIRQQKLQPNNESLSENYRGYNHSPKPYSYNDGNQFIEQPQEHQYNNQSPYTRSPDNPGFIQSQGNAPMTYDQNIPLQTMNNEVYQVPNVLKSYQHGINHVVSSSPTKLLSNQDVRVEKHQAVNNPMAVPNLQSNQMNVRPPRLPAQPKVRAGSPNRQPKYSSRTGPVLKIDPNQLPSLKSQQQLPTNLKGQHSEPTHTGVQPHDGDRNLPPLPTEQKPNKTRSNNTTPMQPQHTSPRNTLQSPNAANHQQKKVHAAPPSGAQYLQIPGSNHGQPLPSTQLPGGSPKRDELGTPNDQPISFSQPQPQIPSGQLPMQHPNNTQGKLGEPQPTIQKPHNHESQNRGQHGQYAPGVHYPVSNPGHPMQHGPPAQYGPPAKYAPPSHYGHPNYGAPLQYGYPAQYGAPMQYGPPAQYGAPAQYGHYGAPGAYAAPAGYRAPTQYGPGGKLPNGGLGMIPTAGRHNKNSAKNKANIRHALNEGFGI